MGFTHPRVWRHTDEVKFSTLEWVDWFNNHRLLESIENIPPAGYKMACYRQLEESAEYEQLDSN